MTTISLEELQVGYIHLCNYVVNEEGLLKLQNWFIEKINEASK